MNFGNLRQQTRQSFSPPIQRNFTISFKLKVAIAEFFWKMQRKTWYFILGVDVMPLSLKNLLLRRNLLFFRIVNSGNHFEYLFNNRFLREEGMASTPKMEYQVFLCIFQKNSAMATLGLKEMEKFLWDGRGKGMPCWLSQLKQN